MTYVEQLKHPKWQKRRLEVLDRSNFQCEGCGSHDKTLHIHHGRYIKGKKAWEYPDEMLHCLCDGCHQRQMVDMDNIYDSLAILNQDELTSVRDLLSAILSIKDDEEHGIVALRELCWLLGLPWKEIDLNHYISQSKWGPGNGISTT